MMMTTMMRYWLYTSIGINARTNVSTRTNVTELKTTSQSVQIQDQFQHLYKDPD